MIIVNKQTVAVILRVMLFFLIFISSSNADADQFLNKSKILKANDIKIFVGEDQKNAIVLHKEDISNYRDSVYLLAVDGVHSLKGKTLERDLLRECGERVAGTGFRKDNKNGFLIAMGKRVQNIAKWYPAKSIKNGKVSSCVKKVATERGAKIHYDASDGIEEIIFQVKWQRTLSKEERQSYCNEMAKWNIGHNSNETEASLTEKCLQQEWACKDEDRNVVGLVDKKGACRLIMDAIIDCDGRPKVGHALDKFLGVLKLKDGGQEEIWFLWNAPGYEGDGIYAIEMSDIGQKDRPTEEWLVYNGC